MIVDASVALKWLVAEDGSDAAAALLDREDLLAPSLIYIEVANALWKKVRLGELRENVSDRIARLGDLVLTVDETPYVGAALDLAVALEHPVYDCIYLATAQALGRRFVTADRRFVERLRGTRWETVADVL